MGFDYSSLEASALRLITDKGRDVTLRAVAEGTYNPGTDTISGASESDSIVKMVMRDFTTRELVETMIERGDKEALVAASGITAPEVNDVIVDGDEYKILNVQQVAPGDTTILYKLQLRR